MRTNHTSNTDSTLDFDLDASPATGRLRRSPRSFGFLAAAALVALSGLGALAAAATSDSSSAAEQRTGTSPASVSLAMPRDTAVPPVDTTADETVAAQLQPQPDPQPQPEPQPEPPATPGILALSTNAIDLPDNVYEGSFDVRNDGGSPIEWTWLMGDYGISVSQDGGTLAPGESVTVYFTINPFQLPAGDFLFANCVYNDDEAKDLHITGHRPQFVVNPDIPKPGLGLAAAS